MPNGDLRTVLDCGNNSPRLVRLAVAASSLLPSPPSSGSRADASDQPHGHPPVHTDLNHGSWSWHCVPDVAFLLPLFPHPRHERGTSPSMRRMGSGAWCSRTPGCRILGSPTARSATQQLSPVMLASGCRARFFPEPISVNHCCACLPASTMHDPYSRLNLLSSQETTSASFLPYAQLSIWQSPRRCIQMAKFGEVRGASALLIRLFLFLFIITFSFFNASFGIWWLVNIY